MGASGKRHLGAFGMTPQRVQERGRTPRSEPAKPVAEFYGDLRALFLAARFLRAIDLSPPFVREVL